MKTFPSVWLTAPLMAMALGAPATPAPAQVTPASAATTGNGTDAPYTLADIRFLAGCWAGTMGSLDMREQWSEPEGGLMLGSTLYLEAGSVTTFEFGLFSEDDSGVTLWPYPGGEKSEHGFPLARVSDDGQEFVFENLEHDFPVRIVYARVGVNEMAPRIEGRDGNARGWSLRRTFCPEN